MKKLVLLFAVLFLVGGVIAQVDQAEENTDQSQQTQPQDDHNSKSSDMPSVTEDKPPKDKKPSLPEQASNTAKNVIDSVFGGIADVFSSIAN